MLSKFARIKPGYRLCFMVLCAIALVGYTRPAINAHLSVHELGVDHSYGLGLITIFDRPEPPAIQLALPDGLGVGQGDLAELAGDFDVLALLDDLGIGRDDLAELTGGFSLIDTMYDAVRLAKLFAVLYLAPLALLLAIFVLAAVGKFALAKRVLLALAFVLFVIAGPVILAVPEIAIDTLAIGLEELFGNLGESLGSLAALLGLSQIINVIGDRIHVIVNEAIHVDLGSGYWITVVLLGYMLLAETAVVLKTRVTISVEDFLRGTRARVASGA
ncbi:MAG: hypothetical protein FWB79_00720 [Treponema sp.]|nr:hypothetical protein [Treponema sp.]